MSISLYGESGWPSKADEDEDMDAESPYPSCESRRDTTMTSKTKSDYTAMTAEQIIRAFYELEHLGLGEKSEELPKGVGLVEACVIIVERDARENRSMLKKLAKKLNVTVADLIAELIVYRIALSQREEEEEELFSSRFGSGSC